LISKKGGVMGLENCPLRCKETASACEVKHFKGLLLCDNCHNWVKTEDAIEYLVCEDMVDVLYTKFCPECVEIREEFRLRRNRR